MKTGKNTQIRLWVPPFVKDILDANANAKLESMNTYVNNILLRHIANDKTHKLTVLERQYIEMKQQETQRDLIKYVRSRNAERLHFMKNIKRNLVNFTNDKGLVNRKLILENIGFNIKYAELNKWEREKQILKKVEKYLKSVPNVDIRLLNEEIDNAKYEQEKIKNIEVQNDTQEV